MKRILIYKRIFSDLECNITTHYKNNEIFNLFKKYYPNHMPNTGNKVWFQGIVNEVSGQNSDISFLTDDMDIDYINNNFDLIIYPMANIFGYKYKTALYEIGTTFEKIKIPTFIISCGIQAKSVDEVDDVVNAIGKEAKEFINAIYATGGQFALRGHITNSFFQKLGYHDAAVVGCPSIYQRGSDLLIDTSKKVDKTEFKAILNGELADYHNKHLFINDKCSFVDQDSYVHPLFNSTFCNDIVTNRKTCIEAIKYYGFYQLEQVFKNNVQLFFETNIWYNYLIKNSFSFSFGSRIHGNIMSILSGIPTLINAKDIRVKEMAELYNIPYVENINISSIDELYDLYCSVDYSQFNDQYPQLYNKYKQFLFSNNIIDDIGISDCFRELSDTEYFNNINYPTQVYFDNALSSINKYKWIFKIRNYIKF